MGETSGFVKFIADATTDELLGCHMIGPNVSELISEVVLAFEYRGSSEDIGITVHAHPTLSEAMKEAALAGRAIHSSRGGNGRDGVLPIAGRLATCPHGASVISRLPSPHLMSFRQVLSSRSTEVKPDILATMSRPMISHRGSEIEAICEDRRALAEGVSHERIPCTPSPRRRRA